MKKMFFKTITLVLTVAFLMTSFSGCSKKKPETETTTSSEFISTSETRTENISETTASSTTISPSKTTTTVKTSSDNNKKSNENLLEVQEKDKETLCKFMAYVLGYGGMPRTKEFDYNDNYSLKDEFDFYFEEYNCNKDSALEYAMYTMVNMGYYDFIEFCEDNYKLKKNTYETIYCSYDDSKSIPLDPLKKYTDDPILYSKINGEKFDALLKTVFNVKANHKYVLNFYGCNAEGLLDPTNAYYYNGYYYVRRWEGGDGAGPRVKIINMTKNADGKYNVTLTYQWGNDDGYKDIAKITATVGLKSFDGCRMWSLYSCEKG